MHSIQSGTTHCDRCECFVAIGKVSENEYGEYICDDCEQNAAEAAWDRHNESLMCGDTPTFRETYLAAYEQKRALK